MGDTLTKAAQMEWKGGIVPTDRRADIRIFVVP
jgi:hypothetical protein